MNYVKLQVTASKIHTRLLHFLTVIMTFFLWLVPVTAVFLIFHIKTAGLRDWLNLWLGLIFLLFYTGMFCTLFWMCIICKRLRIAKRIIVWSMIWIPVLNYILALYVRGLAKQEVDHDLHKIRLDDVRVDRQICRTKYPLLLVHGVGFRDFHYFNYWGRIPRELVRNGARVYYGHQEAWGTVESNGEMLKAKILEIIEETGCEKVNIIAHSKGGLDSRYVISGLNMAPYIASLTTINTPHHGSRLVDFLKKLPDGIYRQICGMIDRYFGRLGDITPNAYLASYQLSEAYAREFNEKYPDAEGIYYQSYASLMRCGFSSKLLCIPYWILKMLDAPSDGLVTVTSAQWTNFKGVIKNKYMRGISHGDMIDLTREDYREFHVLEFYIQLAEELGRTGL